MRTSLTSVVAALGVAVANPAVAQAPAKWEFQATVYAYLPTISGKTTFPPTGGGSGVSADAETILEHLKMAFMGSFEASNGRWGVLTDLIYMDVGDSKSGTQSFSIGNRGIPADASANLDYDLKGWVWTLAGTYRLRSDKDLKIDLLAGTRVLDIRQKLRWDVAGNVGSIAVIDRAGTREVDGQNWDAIVGFKGRGSMGGGWFVPYYLDIGTGNSKFTWQTMVGVGYAFGWGDVIGAWRYIDYQMKSGESIEEVKFNGPTIAAAFRW
jgi:hypothetical protein